MKTVYCVQYINPHVQCNRTVFFESFDHLTEFLKTLDNDSVVNITILPNGHSED